MGKALGPRVQGGSAQLLADLVNAGHKGKKTNSGLKILSINFLGIYTYTTVKGKTSKVVNEKAKAFLNNYRLEAPTAVSSTEDQQLRVVSRFVNEALLCLEEDIIASPVIFLLTFEKYYFIVGWRYC